jgi:hypothetical protein
LPGSNLLIIIIIIKNESRGIIGVKLNGTLYCEALGEGRTLVGLCPSCPKNSK